MRRGGRDSSIEATTRNGEAAFAALVLAGPAFASVDEASFVSSICDSSTCVAKLLRDMRAAASKKHQRKSAAAAPLRVPCAVGSQLAAKRRNEDCAHRRHGGASLDVEAAMSV